MIRLTALGCWFRFTSLVIYAEHMMWSAITIANEVIHTGSLGGSGYFDSSSITTSFFFSFSLFRSHDRDFQVVLCRHSFGPLGGFNPSGLVAAAVVWTELAIVRFNLWPWALGCQ